MELAIATDYAGEHSKIEDLEQEIAEIAASGITHIHWCNEWDGDYLYSGYEMKQIREWMDRYGLKAKSLHASKGSRRGCNRVEGHYRKDYTSEVEYNRLAGVELVKNRVDLAECLGTAEIVLHMYLPYETFEEDPSYKERFYAQVEKSLDELQPYCLEKGVRICIENLFEAPAELQLEQFDRLFDRYPAEFLGLCLDSGHAYLVWGNDFITELAQRYADRIFSIHLHDNKGWKSVPGGGDAHRIPGQGEIDWPAFLKVLAKSAYELPLTLELMTDQRGEGIPGFLKEAYQSGEALMKWYEE